LTDFFRALILQIQIRGIVESARRTQSRMTVFGLTTKLTLVFATQSSAK